MAFITSHFSGKIRTELLKELQKAQSSINVALAWFTDDELMSELMKIKDDKPQVDIQIVISNHEINFRNTMPLTDMVDRGIRLRVTTNRAVLFHHKFCIIDEQTLINGSYNWTRLAANSNEENITIIRLDHTAEPPEKFIEQFKTMFKKYNKDEYSILYDPAVIVEQELQTDFGAEDSEQIKLRREFQEHIRTNMEIVRQINSQKKKEPEKIKIKIIEDMIKRYGGGVNMVKKLLRESNVRDKKGQLKLKEGFKKLVNWGQEQNLSFESMVIDQHFESLFSEEEKLIARRLLQRQE